MPDLYQINDWVSIYENSKSKTIKTPSWCPVPNKQDGLGYGLIMQEDDGTAIYGAFVSVVLMCSKQSVTRRGYLSDTGMPDGRPLSPKELSVKTKVPHATIERMLDVTSSESIGWISNVTTVSPRCHNERPELNRTEQKEQKEQHAQGVPEKTRLPENPKPKEFFDAYKKDKRLVWEWLLSSCEQLNELNFSYESFLAIERCFQHSPAWIIANKLREKMSTAVIDNPKAVAGYMRSIWAALDVIEGKKVRK